jgi:hypothetical protein
MRACGSFASFVVLAALIVGWLIDGSSRIHTSATQQPVPSAVRKVAVTIDDVPTVSIPPSESCDDVALEK